MAPKRQRVNKASSSGANEEAQASNQATQRANKQPTMKEILASYKARCIVQERGIELVGPMEAHIGTQGWLLFINPTHVQEGYKPYVQEFYTYMHMHRGNKIKVRGKSIDISPEAINRFYELRVTGDDEYSAFVNSAYNIEDVIVELTGKQRGILPDWKAISKEWLTPKARLLNLWLSSRMLPATSHSKVAKKRALLLYAMSKGMSINVGRVINAEIRAMTNPSKKTNALGFPSLITQLCVGAGLADIIDPAERVALMGELSWKTFNKPSKSSDGGATGGRSPRLEEQDEGEAQEEGEDGSEGYESDDDDHRTAAIVEEISAIRRELNQHTEEFRAHRDYINDFVRYSIAFNMWMANGQQGTPPIFPPPPS